ncbi:MAG: hypothetical protein WKF65_17770 [Gaiellaceae bacterium]
MRLFVVLAFSLAVFAAGVSPSAAAVGHSKLRAERNIMAAHRVLNRWQVGLVNPRTQLPRNNVWVRCSGRRGRTTEGYTHFRCIIGYRRVRVSVRYFAKAKNAFELHDRRTFRV